MGDDYYYNANIYQHPCKIYPLSEDGGGPYCVRILDAKISLVVDNLSEIEKAFKRIFKKG